MERIEIKLKKSTFIFSIIGTIIAGGPFILLFTTITVFLGIGLFEDFNFFNFLGFVFVGILTFFLFRTIVPPFIYSINRLRSSNRLALIIDNQGITDCTELDRVALVKWCDISEIKVKSYTVIRSAKDGTYDTVTKLLIYVLSSNAYIENSDSTRINNLSSYGTPFAINCAVVKYNNSKLETLLKRLLKEQQAEINKLTELELIEGDINKLISE